MASCLYTLNILARLQNFCCLSDSTIFSGLAFGANTCCFFVSDEKRQIEFDYFSCVAVLISMSECVCVRVLRCLCVWYFS